MKQIFNAHFDGRVFVPDEPVDAPINTPLRLVMENGHPHSELASPETVSVAERLERLKRITGIVTGPPISAESLLRENLYDDGA